MKEQYVQPEIVESSPTEAEQFFEQHEINLRELYFDLVRDLNTDGVLELIPELDNLGYYDHKTGDSVGLLDYNSFLEHFYLKGKHQLGWSVDDDDDGLETHEVWGMVYFKINRLASEYLESSGWLDSHLDEFITLDNVVVDSRDGSQAEWISMYSPLVQIRVLRELQRNNSKIRWRSKVSIVNYLPFLDDKTINMAAFDLPIALLSFSLEHFEHLNMYVAEYLAANGSLDVVMANPGAFENGVDLSVVAEKYKDGPLKSRW